MENNKNQIKKQEVEVFGTNEISVKEFMNGSDKSLMLLSNYDLAKKNLLALKDKHQKRVEELVLIEKLSPSELKELNSIRAELREPRYLIQKIEKNNVTTFESYKKADKANLKLLVEINNALETKVDDRIKLEEERKKNEKEEVARIEREREARLRKSIDDFESDSYHLIQSTVFADVDLKRTMLDALVNKEIDYEEFDILFEQARSRVQNAWDLKCNDIQEKENQRLDNERMKQEIFDVRVILFKEFGFELKDNIIFSSAELPHTYTKDELLSIDSATFERAILNIKQAKEEIEQSKKNAEAKRISELQASRLKEILPYVAFGESLDLTKLSDLQEIDFCNILDSKVKLFEADVEEKRIAKEKLDAENLEIENKAKAEKQIVIDIRKNRLAEIGFVLTEENILRHPEISIEVIQGYLLNSISDASTIEFEEIISEAKLSIEKARLYAKELIEKYEAKEEETKRRCNLISELGFYYSNEHDTYFVAEDSDYILLIEDIADLSEDGFVALFDECKQVIADYNKSKEDAELLKKENKNRQKKYAADKKTISEFIDSLEFQNPIPEFENVEMQEVLDAVVDNIKELKIELKNSLKNY